MDVAALRDVPRLLARETAKHWLAGRGAPAEYLTGDVLDHQVTMAADAATPARQHFPGGVLVRAGHTEAGCDFTALAGLTPASVICEVIKDDGTMARLPDLMEFAQQHGLKIGTIADLIHYRSSTESIAWTMPLLQRMSGVITRAWLT